MEPENLFGVLQDAGIQVDMQNLQNPSEEFMLYVITEYLKKLNLDGNEISKSTEEQLNCLSCPDSAADAIRMINLFSALSSVCNEIFLQDFCLTDITSPGQKRARKQMKILFNFLAYVKDKMAENEAFFIKLDDQQKAIEEMFENKQSTVAKIGATINDRENKLELIQKFQKDEKKIYAEINLNSKKSKELEKKCKDILLQHQEAQKKYSDLKAKAVKLHKETNDLQLKIVKSPEEYAARSKELQNIIEIKKEERQLLTEAINKKKTQIKNNENAEELIQHLNNEFSINSNEIIKQLKQTSEKLDFVQKELDSLRKDIEKYQNLEKNNALDLTNVDDFAGYENLLLELKKQFKNKEKEFNSLKHHEEKLNTKLSDIKIALENESQAITVIKDSNITDINQYKKYFENNLSEEHDVRQTITATLKY